jgi:hypothetical protein
MAGSIYRLAVAALAHWLPYRSAVILSFFATGAVFPLGAALTRLAGGDLFAKSAVLTPLGLLLAAVQLFYRPIIILVWIQAPEWTFYVMAVLFGSHFLPYAWLYRSPAYAVLSILTTVVLTAAVWVAGAPLQETVPLLAAGCYFLSVMLLIREVSRSEPTAG